MCNKAKNFNRGDFIPEDACSSSHASLNFPEILKIINGNIFVQKLLISKKITQFWSYLDELWVSCYHKANGLLGIDIMIWLHLPPADRTYHWSMCIYTCIHMKFVKAIFLLYCTMNQSLVYNIFQVVFAKYGNCQKIKSWIPTSMVHR